MLILLMIFLLPFSVVHAQVIIGGSTVSESQTSSLLEFTSGSGRAIFIHPANLPLCQSATQGAIAFNNSNGSINFCNGTTWATTTGGTTGATVPSTESGKGVIIGSDTSTQKGALILESLSKALIMPKIAHGQLNIKTLKAGLLFYDTATKRINFYNGNFWVEL